MANLLTPNQSTGATGTDGLKAIALYSELERVPDAGVTGGTAVKCSSRGKIDGFEAEIRSTKIPVIQGKEYEFIVWLKRSELVGTLESRIYWYQSKDDSWGVKIGTTNGVKQSSGNDKGIYYKFIARGVAPPGAYYAEVSGAQYAGTFQTSYEFYWSEAYFGITSTKPTISVTTQDNQPLFENQRINISTNDFTVNITANDADPEDTLQYQVKLNNVVKKGWTAISRNQPVSYTFKNADITAGVLPFTIVVRDSTGGETSFNSEITKGKIGKDSQGRTTYTFEYTSKPEMFMVPSNATKLKLECWGASGGRTRNGNLLMEKGGLGGYARSELTTLSQDVLMIYVGGKGEDGIESIGGKGGFNGGGNGGGGLKNTYYGGGGGGGGGASDVRRGTDLTQRILVAGGGGGGGHTSAGGAGDYIGYDAEDYSDRAVGGKGGTQTAGGIGGRIEGKDGGLGFGGTGGKNETTSSSYHFGGGGGGSGYFGGGGGGAAGGVLASCGGGGGSSYYGNLENGSTTAGVREGNGLVVITLLNEPPKFTLSAPSDNQVLKENDKVNIQGTALDLNYGDILVFKCQINNSGIRALDSRVSNGSTPISFSKTLNYQGGRLFDGTLDVSRLLAEGTNHTLSLWVEDNQGGKSDVVTRTFTVKHNKAPIITVGTFPAVQSGLIPPDSITLSGTASDPDGNTLTVKAKLNSGTDQTLLNGVTSGNWSYTCKVSDLKAGANTITITATDQFGLSTVKTFNVTNAVTETPMKKAVARYKILAPKGSAREILAWLKREKGNLVVDAETSFVDKGLPEQYTAMTKESVDLTTSIAEDELISTVATAKSDVMFKLTLGRTNTSAKEAAVMLVGVIS
ncbi:glycine rich domain-containing protein [Brevibacillus laterosporus]|uniref:glycine rich domain-containing protein n=1 Tax=Brevibacillus laterosporus TaxID=1465 RepID=UPI00195D0682|nr:glycine rich domain-containing protein [Brevibacillus laterosporus]MBM7106906.1 Glycine rich protein [Brevibacillus laterosporus]